MHALLLSAARPTRSMQVSDFREKVVPFTHEQGGKGGILLVDRQSGEATWPKRCARASSPASAAAKSPSSRCSS